MHNIENIGPIGINEDLLNIDQLKAKRIIEIDENTNRIIAGGFEFDGCTFSLSIYAQFNWNHLKVNKQEFTFPCDISTINHNVYSIKSADVLEFWRAGKDVVKAALDSGRILKAEIMAAITKEEVLGIIDNR